MAETVIDLPRNNEVGINFIKETTRPSGITSSEVQTVLKPVAFYSPETAFGVAPFERDLALVWRKASPRIYLLHPPASSNAYLDLFAETPRIPRIEGPALKFVLEDRIRIQTVAYHVGQGLLAVYDYNGILRIFKLSKTDMDVGSILKLNCMTGIWSLFRSISPTLRFSQNGLLLYLMMADKKSLVRINLSKSICPPQHTVYQLVFKDPAIIQVSSFNVNDNNVLVIGHERKVSGGGTEGAVMLCRAEEQIILQKAKLMLTEDPDIIYLGYQNIPVGIEFDDFKNLVILASNEPSLILIDHRSLRRIIFRKGVFSLHPTVPETLVNSIDLVRSGPCFYALMRASEKGGQLLDLAKIFRVITAPKAKINY